MMVSAEPPLLQIRMRLSGTVPAVTTPKSMIGSVSVAWSKPPSDVSTLSSAIGAVVAVPDSRIYWVPPFDQTWKILENRPTELALKMAETVTELPAGITVPTLGMSLETKLLPI